MKYCLLVALTILTILLIVQPVSSQPDGDLEFDADNDAPTFLSWYDTESLLTKDVDQRFFAEILDIDNQTSELTVALFYTTDGGSINNSFAMSYDFSTNIAGIYDSYTYEYLFPGQPQATYLQFYYTVYDGNSTVRSPSNPALWYDVQWGESFPTATTQETVSVIQYVNLGGATRTEIIEEISDGTGVVQLLLWLAAFLLIVGGVIQKNISKGASSKKSSMTKVSMRDRKWRGTATGRFLENLERKHDSDD